MSREEERVERRRLAAVSGVRREKDSGVGRAADTEEAKSEGDRERRLRRTETMWVGEGGTEGEGRESE